MGENVKIEGPSDQDRQLCGHTIAMEEWDPAESIKQRQPRSAKGKENGVMPNPTGDHPGGGRECAESNERNRVYLPAFDV